MCAAAISFARIRRLYYGAADPKGGGVEHGARIFSQPTCHHAPELYPGIDEARAAALLQRVLPRAGARIWRCASARSNGRRVCGAGAASSFGRLGGSSGAQRLGLQHARELRLDALLGRLGGGEDLVDLQEVEDLDSGWSRRRCRGRGGGAAASRG